MASGGAGPVRYVSLAEYLLIAEAMTGIDPRRLARGARIGLAESALAAPAASFDGVEVYPTFVEKAAVLVVHPCQNHPLVDGNKRAAFLALLEFVQANGRIWLSSDGDPDETERVIVGVAAGELAVPDVAAWLAGRIG